MKKEITKDFTYESLPKTRREQYFQIIKDNVSLLFKIGLICLLFLLPLLLSFFIKESTLRGINGDVSMTLEEKEQMSLFVELIFNAIYVLCITIFFIGLNGILKIFRRLIWNEPLFFSNDLFLGIKDNIGQSILVGFLVGIIYFACFAIYRFSFSEIRYISYILAAISFAIIVPILIQALYLSSIYKNKFKVSLFTSARLFIRRGFLFVLPLFVIYSMYLVSSIPLGTIYLSLIYIALFVIALPLLLLMNYIINIKIIDDYINSYHFPKQAYLGLYISKELQKKIDENVKKAEQENTL